MAAPKGNQFWKARSKHGRNPIFATPDELWAACQEYFEWAEKNPLLEGTVVAFQGRAKVFSVPKMRAMTIGGMCIFLDISPNTWFDYAKKEGFSEITTRAEQIIRTQKFEGASAGLLNANIIARDLGLADRQERTGRNGEPMQFEEVGALERITRRITDGAARVGAAKDTSKPD